MRVCSVDPQLSLLMPLFWVIQ